MTNTLFAHVRVHVQYMLYYVSCIHVSVVFDENNLLFFGFLAYVLHRTAGHNRR